MTSLSINAYLSRSLDHINISFYCKLSASLNDYKESSTLMQAAGHETKELDQAINDVAASIERLKLANKAAIAKFKSEGIRFTKEDYTFNSSAPADSGSSPSATSPRIL